MFMFEIGQQYETLQGDLVTVLGRTDTIGYECLICSDNKHRYDRSTHSEDAGRVTGTTDRSFKGDNFKRDLL